MNFAIGELAETVKAIAETLAIVIGGIWVYWKFIREREDAPHIEFTVGVRFVARVQDEWLVELMARLENKGRVRHRLRDFTFDLRSLQPGKALREGDESINNAISFDNLVKHGTWKPAKWNYTFIEPGIVQAYSHLARFPATHTCLLLHGHFAYDDPHHDFHTAECVAVVPREGERVEVGPRQSAA